MVPCGYTRRMNSEDLWRDLALLTARLTLGGSIAAHGAQKLFGAFDGPGIEKAAGIFETLGFPDGERYARAASMAELTSGGLIALGAFGPVGPAMLVSVMAVAVETVHRPKGYFSQNGGYEMNTMYALIALLLATNGPGRISVDSLFGLNRRLRAVHGWLALAGGIAGAAMILGKRETPQQKRQTTGTTGQVESQQVEA